ncbi:alpha-mannosidase [Paenibacillus sp. JX-17]|uniref:Alpha-mannosidase n=1 Tax=Paenibacillus lacisoli TaxID=3064525 RepID=A0ABT9CFX4_9BACL|nr:alpha-mannosidase [Paenibacillus sp. JX-17]MDO7908178.1 alpha-mannosidase [Paenibacillus sp. JX-17]
MNRHTTAHVISHTHWDREWYLPYEKHHMRLVSLMDTLLDTLERDQDYRSFYLDGQTIILEDYLQVRPDQQKRLEQYIREGRIIIGPWYILQDAFLTSGEANIRNMQIGHRDAARYGIPAKIGYFPDTFGLVGQIPQLMVQSGINNVFFGRGVKPTGFNNTVADGGYESSFSEMIWRGPDGSEVLGILFANWYSNGNEVPVEEQEARSFWDRKLSDAEKYAATNELLYMNGCDHQPIQRDLAEALRTAGKLHPEVQFIHSNFPDYLEALAQQLQGKELSSVQGELRSQRTDGWGTLVNTASARVYLKQMNQRGQALLEKVAEPLAAAAHLLGQRYPHHLFTYAWKTLMQNHPHDSICGCSVDEVHREMVTRFDKSRHVAETLVEESSRAIADAVDTSVFAGYGEEALPVIVFNTTGWVRSGTVSIDIDVERHYFRDGRPLDEIAGLVEAVDVSGRILVDSDGRRLACGVEDLGTQFGYDLPDDRFRQPYMCRRVRLTFEVEQIPALGMALYAWVREKHGKPQALPAAAAGSLLKNQRTLENEWLQIEVADDGSFTLLDKKTGQLYRDLGIYEDTGDIGNEYMYRQPDGEQALTTRGLAAEIQVLEATPYRAALQIKHRWEVPCSADEVLEREQRELVWYPHRKAQRSNELVTLDITTVISLSRSSAGVELDITMNNTAKDHRLRVLFPTDLEADVHQADSMFEIVDRDQTPAPEWENPSNTQHQQAFVDVSGANAGLTVANRGLQEYEILRDGRNTVAVTLLRSVGELGDWGWFPTPEAQCLGRQTANLKLIPHSGDGIASGSYADAYQYQVPWTVRQTDVHSGSVQPNYIPLQWEAPGLAFSSLKVNEKTGDLMIRWFNMTREQTLLKLVSERPVEQVYRSTILEERGQETERQSRDNGSTEVRQPVGPCEIVTLGLKLEN